MRATPIRVLATIAFASLLLMSACATPRSGASQAPAAPPASTAAVPPPVPAPAPLSPRSPGEAFLLPEADPAAAAAAASDVLLPRDPAVRAGVLPNGVRWFVRQNGKPEKRVEIRLAVRAGSVLEDEDQRGFAHFVEHMAFNGTKNFAKQELIDYLEGIGMRFGPDLNAYTSFDETVYMLQVPTDDAATLERGFLILQDWASGLSFESEEIDKERGVILEEWRQGRGAGARIRDKQFPVLLQGSRYAERLPIGLREIIEGGSHDALRRFYRDWYRPELMAVVAVGDEDPDRLAALIEKHFAALANPQPARKRESFGVPPHEDPLVSVATDPEVTTTSVTIYDKRPEEPLLTHGDYRRSVVDDLAFGMLNERLAELSEQADPPFVAAFFGAGSFVGGIDVTIARVIAREGQTERGLGSALTEAERVVRHGFTQSELERTKAEVLSQLESAYFERDKEESYGYAGELVGHYLDDDPIPGIAYELALHRRFLPGIELAEVDAAARRLLASGSRVVLYSGPEKDGVTHPAPEALLAVAKNTGAQEIAPYVDRVIDEPLLPEAPAGSAVVERKEYPAVGVTRLALANGVKVYIKPTTLQNDEILLRAFSPGGYSLVEDEEHVLASLADSIVVESGIGPFNSADLRRYLAGKQAFARPFLDEDYEGFSGSATRTDFETMLELLYAWATSPRQDPAAFDALRTSWREFVRNRTSDPNAVFSDEVERVMWGGHFAHRPFTETDIDALDAERALAIFRERFADLGDLTVVLVGNIDLAQDEPLIRQYLGGLPAAGRKETWRDLGDRRALGPQKVEVRRGAEPKSRVRLSWHGPATFDRESRFAMRALTDALDIRLREILREDMGGTYGVGVGGGLWKDPVPGYAIDVTFGCAPESVEAMIAAVEEEIARVVRDGVPAEVADKVRQQMIREREVSLQRNGFWISTLAYTLQIEESIDDIPAYEKLFETVNPQLVQDAARRYLTGDNRLRAVLLPES